MPQQSTDDAIVSHRYALCVGIGQYTELRNRNLRYAVKDAATLAERLHDSQRGNFAVTLLTEPAQTSKTALDDALDELLNAPDRRAEDFVVIYFSCHGDVYTPDNTFCLLPSNATQQADGTFKRTTLLGIYDLAKLLSGAKAQNIVVLLDVCHSGGAGVALQHLKLDLGAGPNLFIIGAARQDQVTMQSSQLQHGIFTHCLLRAFEQPPTKDGWLTVSQIRSFVSDDIQWFAKEHPISIQEWSVSVNPNLPLLRNPGYPELCPLPPLWNVPLQRNPFFTGQDNLLSQLASILQSEQKSALTQPQAISGLGGIGKTQLALEYAYRHRQDYHAVLWSLADTREALISTFVTIAHLLDLPQKDEQDQLITVEAVKTWLARRSNWLLILDNADELAMTKEFIPPAFQGHLLLTTRAQVMGGLARKLEVEVMRPEIGALLLLRRAGLIAPDASLEQASPADVTVAKELSEEMGGLPLALDQAGAYIEEVSCSLQEYQRLYQTRRAELLKERGGVMPNHPASVATTWSLAFQKVEKGHPAASDLLRLCAFLHPDAIPEEIITQGAERLDSQLQEIAKDPLALNKAISTLRTYSLIHRDSIARTLSIHRLVQAVLKDGMNKETQQQWAERTVNMVSKVFPSVEFEVEFEVWPFCERLIPHVQACVLLINQWKMASPEAGRLLNQAATYLRERGRYLDALPLSQLALAIREQVLGPMHPDTAESLQELGLLYNYQGNNTEALPLYQRALAIREQVLEPMHLDTAESLGDLAMLYERLGNYTEAISFSQRALAAFEQALGPIHPATASCLSNLAMLYKRLGKYTEALPLYQRALAIREQVLGSMHPKTAESLNNLAMLYLGQGKYPEALPLSERALAIREAVLDPTHPDMAQSLQNLAMLYDLLGKDIEAESLYQQAIVIREKAGNLMHTDAAACLHNLAMLYKKRGDYTKALPLLQRALAIDERELGPMHPDKAHTLTSLATLYLDQGKYVEALPLLQQALRICEQVRGPMHPDTAYPLRKLATLHKYQGNYTEAESLYQRALAIYEQQLGPDHPQAKAVREDYTELLQIMGEQRSQST